MKNLWEMTTVDNFVTFKLLVIRVKPKVQNLLGPLKERVVLSPAAGPSGRGGGSRLLNHLKEERGKGRERAVYTLIYVICMHVYVQITNWSLVGCCSVAFHIKVVI